MGKMERITAYVEPSGYSASATMYINADFVNDVESYIEFIKYSSTPQKLKLIAHSVEITEGKETAYVITHEFAHSIFTTRPQKEIFSIYGKEKGKEISGIQRKFKELYSEYVREINEAQNELIEINKKLNSADLDDVEFVELFSKQKKVIDRIEDIKISKYATENQDEFIAEAFTQSQIGKHKSPYTIKVVELLNKVFKK